LFGAEHEFFGDGCWEVSGDGLHGLCHGLASTEGAAHEFESICELGSHVILSFVSEHANLEEWQWADDGCGEQGEGDTASDEEGEQSGDESGGGHASIDDGWWELESGLIDHIANFFMPCATIFCGIDELVEFRLAHLAEHGVFRAVSLAAAEFFFDASAEFDFVAEEDIAGERVESSDAEDCGEEC
jgi:hypothetical protein